MDYPEYDKVRRSAVPLQLDVVEAYAAGRLSRREFIQRATVLGLSMGAIGMVIAACSGTTSSPSAERGRERRRRREHAAGVGGRERPRGLGQDRRHDPDRLPASEEPGPGHDDRPGELRDHLAVVRVPVHPGPQRDRHRAGSGPVVGARLDPQGVDVQAAPGRDLAGRHPVHLGGCGRDDGAPGQGRQLGPQGRHRRGIGGRDRREHGHLQPPGCQRQLPVPRLGVQRPDADHPGRVCRRHDAGQGARGDRRVEDG